MFIKRERKKVINSIKFMKSFKNIFQLKGKKKNSIKEQNKYEENRHKTDGEL